jgi:hypothetical protein
MDEIRTAKFESDYSRGTFLINRQQKTLQDRL